MNSPLAIGGLAKRYGSRPVLADLHLSVAPGEVVAVLGANGAGKSTLLGCVAGTVAADSGTVRIGGHDLAADPLAARAALRYLPQEAEVLAGLTGREILEIHAAIFRAPLSPAALALADLGDALDHLATTYSVGMRRRLLLAALLAGEAALWVLDEPFAGLDRPSRARLVDHLRAAARRGAGILLAGHDPEEPELALLAARPFTLAAPLPRDRSHGT